VARDGSDACALSLLRRCFPRLRLVPERVLFGERRVLRRLAQLGQRLLNGGKPALEFLIGLPQQRFGIGVEVAREIDCGKQ